MALIDFKEIPKANVANGMQDSFELFTREFLHAIGLSIDEDPDRGQDGGRDIIVTEKLTGILEDSEARWLVSCKHKIHSGASVNVKDVLLKRGFAMADETRIQVLNGKRFITNRIVKLQLL